MIDFDKYESLNSEKQAEHFRLSSIKEKGELLIRSHEPAQLVRSLSQEELYLIIREMDLQERSEVLRYANLPQLYFISDIEVWQKDRIVPKQFISWLETLQEAGAEVLARWLVYSEYEMLIAGFLQVIRVVKTEREYAMDEVLGDLPYFTLDDAYYVSVREEDLETVKRAFEVLFETNKGRYYAVMEGILSESDDQIEEEAYLSRERRLSERGFPSPESANKIYQRMTLDEFEAFPPKNLLPDAEAGIVDSLSEVKNPPNYLTIWSHDRLFWDEVLSFLAESDPKTYEQVREELAWLGNKVIACEGIDFSSEEKVRRGIERARHFVNLGLELLSEKDVIQAANLLKTRWVETVFRWAATKIYALRDRAQAVVRIYWEGAKEPCLRFLSAPYDDIFRGLLHRVPEYSQGQTSADEFYRDFTTMSDLERMDSAMSQIESMHRILQDDHSPMFSQVKQSLLNHEEGSLDLFLLLNQSLANYVLKGTVSSDTLSPQEAADFIQKAFERDGKRMLLRTAIKEGFLNCFFTPLAWASLTPLWALAFDGLIDEISDLKIDKSMDWGMLNTLRVHQRKA